MNEGRPGGRQDEGVRGGSVGGMDPCFAVGDAMGALGVEAGLVLTAKTGIKRHLSQLPVQAE